MVAIRVTVDDVNGGAAAALLDVTVSSNAVVTSTAADRGPGCTHVDATILDCDLGSFSADSTTAHVAIYIRKTAPGPMQLTVSTSISDATPVDNSVTAVIADPPSTTAFQPPTTYCVVPRLHGLKLARARVRAVRAGCTLEVGRTVHAPIGAGRVVTQSPRPGRRLPHLARIRITIASGSA
jgi:hypothetical protein